MKRFAIRAAATLMVMLITLCAMPAVSESVNFRSAYTPILDKYYDTLSKSSQPSDLTDKGLNILSTLCFGEDNDLLANMGYTYRDVDNNGVMELLIGSPLSDWENVVFEMYTLDGSKPVLVFESSERDRKSIGKDGYILSKGSDGAGFSMLERYTLTDNGKSLTFHDAIVYNADFDESAPWFTVSESGSDNTDAYQAVTEKEWNQLVKAFDKEYAWVNYTLFTAYPDAARLFTNLKIAEKDKASSKATSKASEDEDKDDEDEDEDEEEDKGSSAKGTKEEKESEWEAFVASDEGAAMFAKPDDAGDPVTQIEKDASVYIYSLGLAWCDVMYGSERGYVKTQSLRFSEDGKETLVTSAAPNAGKLTLRKKASINSTNLDSVPNSSILVAFEKSGTFTKVIFRGRTGYLLTKYLKTRKAVDESELATVILPKGAKGDTVNLREKESRSSRAIANVPVGSTAVVLERGKTWCQIEVDGSLGFMMTTYLEFEESADEE